MFYIDEKCKYNILTMNANIVATLLSVSGAKSSRVLSRTGRARVKHCQRTFDFCHQEDDLDDLYIIGRFCLTRKMITLPNSLKSSSFAVGISFFKH